MGKIYTALAISVHQIEPRIYEAKEIEQILDETPVVNLAQLNFWKWMAQYYMCTLGDVMRAALPGAFLLESESIIKRISKTPIEPHLDAIDEDGLAILNAFEGNSILRISEVMQVLNKKEGPFTAMDEQRLRAFCSQTSIAIENAQLFDEIVTVKNYNEAILESMKSGLITVDAEGRVTKANQAAQDLLLDPDGEDTLVMASVEEKKSQLEYLESMINELEEKYRVNLSNLLYRYRAVKIFL